ncbi:MAG: hypothetical protein U0229_15495 [Anaeromyxobacter sp.]
MRHAGRCHCGNLIVTFESSRPPAEAPLRTCGCTFCARHRPTYTTDPAGRLEVRARDPGLVTRYRFGLATADFLLCSRCGVFVGAVCEVDGRLLGTLNVNVLEDRAAFTQAPAPVDYDAENVAARLARRARAWMPAVVGG